MKNLLLIISMILLDVVGCGPRNEEKEDYLNVSPNEVVLENYAGESGAFSVSTSLFSWTVKTDFASDEKWLEVKINKDSKDRDGEIIVTALSRNKYPIDRICFLNISAGGIERKVVVTQKGE